MHAVAQRFAWELPHAAQSTRPCRAHHRVDRLIRHVRQLLPRHLHTCTAPCSCMRSEPTLRYGTRHRSTACAPGAWHLQSRVYDAQRNSASRDGPRESRSLPYVGSRGGPCAVPAYVRLCHRRLRRSRAQGAHYCRMQVLVGGDDADDVGGEAARLAARRKVQRVARSVRHEPTGL